jgi:hypothetical protein
VARQCQEHTRACGDEDRTNAPAPLNRSTIFAKFDFVLKGFMHREFPILTAIRQTANPPDGVLRERLIRACLNIPPTPAFPTWLNSA